MTLLLLSGCASSGVKKIDDAGNRPLPGDLKACFKDRTPAPKPGNMTAAYAMDFIARQQLREEKHVRCGTRLINLYEGQ